MLSGHRQQIFEDLLSGLSLTGHHPLMERTGATNWVGFIIFLIVMAGCVVMTPSALEVAL